MIRSFRNSTALVACLSMAMPVTGFAETQQPDAEAAQAAADRAAEMPAMAARLASELDAGLSNDDLMCLDGAARPCADGVTLVTPMGLAVERSESGTIYLAPVADQPYRVTEANELAPRPGNEAEAAAHAALIADDAQQPQDLQEALTGMMDRARGDAAEVAETVGEGAEATGEAARDGLATALDALTGNDATAEADRAAEEARAAAEAEAQAAAEAEAQAAEAAAEAEARAAAEAAAEAQTEAEAAAATQAAEAAAEATPAQDTVDALAAALEGTPDEQIEAAQAATAEAQGNDLGADNYAAQETRIANAEATDLAALRAEQMPGMATMLAVEIENGLQLSDLRCADGTARPCGDDSFLMTPQGIGVEISQDGKLLLAGVEEQPFRVGETGQLVPRGSYTAAAQAAAEAEAPEAAALAETDPAQAEVVTETVETARSSAQDFETRIADAIRQAGEQPAQSATESNRDRDLARAALVGLGAFAVGQMLSNNREVALNTGDRVIVTRADGTQEVLKDDNMLLRQPGAQVQTENFTDGSSRTTVTREDGSRVITIRGADLSVLRRVHIAPDGTETTLIDETVAVEPVRVADLPQAPAQATAQPAATDEAALRAALAREAQISRGFTLSQIRTIPQVRNLVAPIDIDAITFDTASAAITPDQARSLATLGTVIQDAIRANPREIFLIEGHTDAVGSATFNLALSDRRAESVALALTEYFAVPPENLIVQGYGEEYLKIQTPYAERENRRASVRRITDLLATTR